MIQDLQFQIFAKTLSQKGHIVIRIEKEKASITNNQYYMHLFFKNNVINWNISDHIKCILQMPRITDLESYSPKLLH